MLWPGKLDEVPWVCTCSPAPSVDAHLVLDGAQVGQDDAKAHGHDEDEDPRDALAQAPQQHRVQRRHIGAVPRCVEIDKVEVPAASNQPYSGIDIKLSQWTPISVPEADNVIQMALPGA